MDPFLPLLTPEPFEDVTVPPGTLLLYLAARPLTTDPGKTGRKKHCRT